MVFIVFFVFLQLRMISYDTLGFLIYRDIIVYIILYIYILSYTIIYTNIIYVYMNM